MICVSLQKKSFKEILTSIKKLSFAEIRLENTDLKKHQIDAIFSSQTKLIATYRSLKNNQKTSLKNSEQKRFEVLKTAILAGANYVDLELDADFDFKKEIIEIAKTKKCSIIISYHNFEKTPALKELKNKIDECAFWTSDIIKIACFAKTTSDVIRMLSLLNDERTIIAIAMGHKGKISRIAGPLLGSPFTYVSETKGSETAMGQLDLNATKKIYMKMGVLID